jgi:hypothetical protein
MSATGTDLTLVVVIFESPPDSNERKERIMKCVISLVTMGILTSLASAQPLNWRNPRTEAEYLAIEQTGQLTPPQELSDLFESDITSIRSAYPEVADIHVHPQWVPGEVGVDMTRMAYEQFKAGEFDGFNSLFESLGTPEVSLRGEHPAFIPGLWLSFNKVYHGRRLADLFRGFEGVTAAYPNGVFGGADDIDVLGERVYEFSHGFGDCPAGCMGRTRWRFRVSDSGVQNISLVPEPTAFRSFASCFVCLTTLVRSRRHYT